MKNTYFFSGDLHLSAALLLHRHVLEKIDFPIHHTKARFIFKDSPLLQADVKRYYDKELLVPALPYGDQIKNLKTRISTASEQIQHEEDESWEYRR
jgi:hypothetical protein